MRIQRTVDLFFCVVQVVVCENGLEAVGHRVGGCRNGHFGDVLRREAACRMLRSSMGQLVGSVGPGGSVRRRSLGLHIRRDVGASLLGRRVWTLESTCVLSARCLNLGPFYCDLASHAVSLSFLFLCHLRNILLIFTMASPITPDAALADLQATALTARCHNVFFRQKQLKSLHDTLRINKNFIKDAIKQDARVSDAEATTEVALALETVKEHYSSLDSKKELSEEYRITSNKDASDWRNPWGVVYIEPQRSHTPFFSVVVALSSALTAGNCVALKV
jgi:hypothetical protein